MNLMRTRVVAAMGAGAFGQLISIAIQVGSLPLFLLQWDVQRYGVWLMLSAIPAYLSMADVGMVATAGNRMTMEMARGQVALANRIFHSATAFMALVCLGVALVSVLVLLSGATGLPRDQAWALWLLILTVLLALFAGLSEAVFKASDRYAQGAMWGNLLRLAEWGGALSGLLWSGSYTAVAAGGLLARALGLVWVMRQAARQSNGLTWGWRHASEGEVRAMVRPAVSFMAFPLANAMTFQGGTLLVGHLFGPAAVTVFNAGRTLSRIAVQITSVFAHALWVEFSRLFGLVQLEVLSGVYARSLRTGMWASLGLSALLFAVGPILLQVWTHGRIAFMPSVMGVLLVYAAIAGIWHVPRVLLMACNQHVNLAPWSLALAGLMLVLSYLMGLRWGMVGVGAGMLVSELIMAIVSLFLASSLLRQPRETGVLAS